MLLARIGFAAIFWLAVATPAVATNEAVLQEEPPAQSVDEDQGAFDRAFDDDEVRPTLFPRLKRRLEKLPPFFADSVIQADLRSYYFGRRTTGDAIQEAWATGGNLSYRSGWLWDRIQVGGAFYGSLKLVAQDSRDGSLLLRPRQRSYQVFGEGFVRLRHAQHTLSLYRQRLDVPYVNGTDSRMTPNTFEGVVLGSQGTRLDYVIGHLTQIKLRNSEHFESFSNAAGVTGESSNGLTTAGFRLRPTGDTSVGAINHFVKDTLNTLYVEAEGFRGDRDGWGIRGGFQFTDQRSVGDDRLRGSSLSTWVVGAKAGVSFQQAILSAAFSVTDDDATVLNPWGSYPGYLAMMQRNFNRANEKAWGLGASWYFGRVGLPDLSIAVRHSEGYDARDPLTGKKLSDRRELNVTLDYRRSKGRLRGLWLRARFGWGDEDDTRRDSLEARVVLRYDLPVL